MVIPSSDSQSTNLTNLHDTIGVVDVASSLQKVHYKQWKMMRNSNNGQLVIMHHSINNHYPIKEKSIIFFI